MIDADLERERALSTTEDSELSRERALSAQAVPPSPAEPGAPGLSEEQISEPTGDAKVALVVADYIEKQGFQRRAESVRAVVAEIRRLRASGSESKEPVFPYCTATLAPPHVCPFWRINRTCNDCKNWVTGSGKAGDK